MVAADGHALLVEDDEDVAALLRYHLESLGYAVRHVFSAEDAFDDITARSFDLAVVDIILPGADGREVVRRLKACPDNSGCRVVIASIVEAEDVGVAADAILAKPFRRGDVVRALECAGVSGGGR